VCDDAVAEINRVLGRSAGTRRVERLGDGAFARTFVPTGDARRLDDPMSICGRCGRRARARATVRRCSGANRVLDTTKNGADAGATWELRNGPWLRAIARGTCRVRLLGAPARRRIG
jgi:hypothetical protein